MTLNIVICSLIDQDCVFFLQKTGALNKVSALLKKIHFPVKKGLRKKMQDL